MVPDSSQSPGASPGVHTMTIEAQNADEVLFACTRSACGRRVVAGRSGVTVLARGDFAARHVGSRGALGMSPVRYA